VGLDTAEASAQLTPLTVEVGVEPRLDGHPGGNRRHARAAELHDEHHRGSHHQTPHQRQPADEEQPVPLSALALRGK